LVGDFHNSFGDSEKDCSIIKQIDYLKNVYITDIACGNNHCLTIKVKYTAGEIINLVNLEKVKNN
jgi:hypothetical protein